MPDFIINERNTEQTASSGSADAAAPTSGLPVLVAQWQTLKNKPDKELTLACFVEFETWWPWLSPDQQKEIAGKRVAVLKLNVSKAKRAKDAVTTSVKKQKVSDAGYTGSRSCPSALAHEAVGLQVCGGAVNSM